MNDINKLIDQFENDVEDHALALACSESIGEMKQKEKAREKSKAALVKAVAELKGKK